MYRYTVSPNTMSTAVTAVFQSLHRSACEERALVLLAVGIPSVIATDGGQFLLEVDIAHAAVALSELRHYEAESRPPPPPPPAPRLHGFAWVGCLAYVAIRL